MYASPTHPSFGPLLRHRVIVLALYALASALTVRALTLPGATKDSVSLLSTGAILATFGSAIATLGSIFERDPLERVRLNVDILFKDLLGQENPWRRWPFLPRLRERQNLDGTLLLGTLGNPRVPLDVGAHLVHIEVPTALEDFFDLSVCSNFAALSGFRAAAAAAYSTKRSQGEPSQPEPESDPSTESKSKPAKNSDVRSTGDQLMQYECLYDTWRSILTFRLSRYTTHFGAAVTLSGSVATIALFLRAA